MKNIIPIVLFLVIVGGLFYFFDYKNKQQNNMSQQQSQTTNQVSNQTAQPANSLLKKEIIKDGAGVEAKAGDKITVNYTGKLENGTQFDSSIGREPFIFTLGQGVIEGWSQGLLGAKVGEKLRLTIPPDLGYGSKDMGKIPPNSTLIFDIEVLKIGE